MYGGTTSVWTLKIVKELIRETRVERLKSIFLLKPVYAHTRVLSRDVIGNNGH